MNKTMMTCAWLLLCALNVSAKDGYRISLRMPDIPDSMVYLAHYYGDNRPKIFIADSARLDKRGAAILESSKKDFAGGIYIILVKEKGQANFEFLLNKGDDIGITAYRNKLPEGVEFRNSVENEGFKKYLDFIAEFAQKQKDIEAELTAARTAGDTAAVRAKAGDAAKARTKYMRDYVAKHPGTLLANIFNAMELPEVPEGPHLLPDGKTKDSTYAYTYYKAHYWDKFNFEDDRLIFTPIYAAKLDEYMNKLVLPWPDSVKHESDMLLKKAQGTRDVFKYTLWWLTRSAEGSKVMGMDEVFVHLVENYYMKGDAYWLTNDELIKYTDRAMKIAPNVIGNLAPEVKLPNVIATRSESLHELKAKYTLLVFYSPTCGHCEHELPLLDSLYEAVLKGKGVKVYTSATEGDDKAIKAFLQKHKLDQKWTNTWDPQHLFDHRGKYDVYSTPTIYLLDEKKKIRGKRLDHTNIGNLIEMLDKKALTKS